jgi:hypothetical protein
MDDYFSPVSVSGFGPNSFGASPDGLGARPFGAEEIVIETNPARKTLALLWGIAGVAGAALGAYHGYKRNESVGWAIGWSLLGGLVPVIVIPLAFAQGLGKRK